MGGGDRTGAGARTVTYCLIPFELAPRLHDLLREHFSDQPVEVVVERRTRERRGPERRTSGEMAGTERRRIRNADGRRVGPRRAELVRGESRALPRRARQYADRIVFAERLEMADERLSDLEAARLVTRFQAGDEEAFAALYMRYFDRVYGYLRTIFRDDPHDVEDMTQQVFMRVFEALPRYERRAQPFRAWLFVIVRNLARTNLTRRGRAEVTGEPPWIAEQRDASEMDEAPEVGLDWVTDRELVMFVERLPLAQRQVLLLRYMLDLPAKEIGAILGRKADDVRILEYRALRFLEARLTAIGRRSALERRRPLRTYGRISWMRVLRSRGGALRYNAQVP